MNVNLLKQRRNRNVLLSLFMLIFLPLSLNAASFSFSPEIGSYSPGDNIVTYLYLVPAPGETITAAQVSLKFPTDKLDVVSYNPATGGNIFIHMGTKTDNTAGTIVDNVSFRPGITSSTKIATITFKAKTEGDALLLSDNNAKILDSNNNNKISASRSAKYTVKATAPEPEPEPETQVSSNDQTESRAPVVQPRPKTYSKPQLTKETKSEEVSEEKQDKENASTTDLTEKEPAGEELDNQKGQIAAAAGADKNYKWLWWLLLLILIALASYTVYAKKGKN